MRTDALRNRTAIVDAARELVARDGEDVTVDALAARAGVAVGTLYRHFPAKSDLVAAVVAETVDRIAASAEAALARTRDGATAWDELTWFFTAIDDGHSAGRTVRLAARLLGLTADGTPADGAVRALAAVSALLADAQAAGDMRADATLADLFMLMAQAPERGTDGLRDRYVEIVKDGLRPPSTRRVSRSLAHHQTVGRVKPAG